MDYNIFYTRILTSIFLFIIFYFFFYYLDKQIIYLSYIIYFLVLLEIIIYFRKNNYIFYITIIYIFFSLICLEFYFRLFFLKIELIFIILLISIFDINSYIFGSKFGKLKILPIISPNKTLLGLIFGFSSALIFGLIFNFYYNLFNEYLIIFFIILILTSAFFGDVIESYFKRKSEIKNSSNFLPGHGGFFDRFDSYFMVFISLLLFKILI